MLMVPNFPRCVKNHCHRAKAQLQLNKYYYYYYTVLRARGILKDAAVDGSVIVQDEERQLNVALSGVCYVNFRRP